jgi:hypothetical protein
MRSNDWKQRIVDLVRIKQELADRDAEGLWEWHLPAVAASEEQLAAVEEQLGERLDPSYREFLRHASGWRAFFQSVDLFGPEDLLGDRRDRARRLLETVDDAVGTEYGDELLPIGLSEVDRHLFGIGRPGSSIPGTVVWLSCEEVDRWSGFDEFFLAMMDYNRADAEDLRRDARGC